MLKDPAIYVVDIEKKINSTENHFCCVSNYLAVPLLQLGFKSDY